jgi:predicted O-methyltransferase YrrM
VSAFFRIKSFFSYWLNAVDEHSLHSPFFFDLYTSQIKASAGSHQFTHIEALRRKLLRDERAIDINDLGVKAKEKSRRKISDIARTSLSTPRFSLLYLRLASYFQARSIIELGTCLGINTLYLAEKRDAAITTFEGSSALAEIATLTFQFAAKENVRLIVGNIDHTLPAFLEHLKRIDLAFMDANHRYEPTIQYFDWLVKKVHPNSIIIIDDIHYSPEMAAAWKVIKNHRLVYASADLFRCGIVFFDPSLNKQHVILQV